MKKILFVDFIHFLEKKNITYVILGNSETYPEDIGSDVDIALDKNSFSKINSLLTDFSLEYHVDICNLLQHEIEGKYIIASSLNYKISNYEMLALDFCVNYMRQGRIIITNEDLLASKQKVEQNGVEFWVCNNAIAFIYYLIKKIEKNSIDENQFSYLLNLWKQSREEIMLNLNERFDSTPLKQLVSIFDNENFSYFSKELISNLSKTSHAIYKRSLKNQLLEFNRKVKRFLNPTGVVICALGCDGSGKSTVIKQLMEHSNEFEAFRSKSYHHLYATKKTASNSPVLNPHDQKSRTRIMSDLKLLYFFYKYTSGYWTIVYTQKVRSNLVVFDRYYHDILVDPKRYRHNGSNWLTNLVGKMIPKPDLFFVIDAPAEILQSRKSEVSFEESKRQREAYLQLKEVIPNLTVIDNSRDLMEASFHVKRVIHDYLVERYKKRYSN